MRDDVCDCCGTEAAVVSVVSHDNPELVGVQLCGDCAGLEG